MREKWLSVNWRELIIKTLMMLSYVSWIYLAIPASENGKIVGCGLLIIIFFFVIKMSMSEYLDGIVNKGKKTVFFISIIIALYYIGTYYYQSGEGVSVRRMSGMAVLEFPAIYLSVLYFTGNGKKMKKDEKIRRIFEKGQQVLPKCLGITAVLLLVIYSASYSIWFDETFTIGLIQHSYKELIYLTGRDVHPPLYYILLKGFTESIRFVLPQVPTIYLARLFSGIPYAFLLIFLLSMRKTIEDRLISDIMLLALCMPNFMDYGIEVRMYSLALVLIFFAYMTGYRIYYGYVQGWKQWIILAIVSLLSIYTHYYCGICVIAIYAFLFFKKLKTGELIRCLISGSILVIGYLPWLSILFTTLTSVSERTWPEAVSFKTIFESVRFLVGYYGTIIIVFPTVLWGIAAFRKSKKDNAYVLMGVLLPFLLMGLGELVSALYTPVWQKRYMVIAAGCMWFAVAQYVKELKSQGYQIRIISFMAVVGLIDLFVFVRHEQVDKTAAAAVVKEILIENPDTTILTYDTEIAYSVSTAMNRKCILGAQIGPYLETIYSRNLEVHSEVSEEMLQKMKPVLILMKDTEDIQEDSDIKVINGVAFKKLR